MTDDLQQLRAEVAELRQTIRLLQVLAAAPTPDAIVGAEYVATLTGNSVESVVRGRFGADRLRRVREKPVGFVKREVDEWHRKNIMPRAEKAALIRSRTKERKKR